MFHQNYEIRSYHPDFKTQIINLERFLWGENVKENTVYFDWKYEKNPYTKEVIGVVGLHKGKVVGFIGFPVSKWFLSGEKNIFMLLMALIHVSI